MEHVTLAETLWKLAAAWGGLGLGVVLFVGLPMLRDRIKRRG
jgi:hypothetical protein